MLGSWGERSREGGTEERAEDGKTWSRQRHQPRGLGNKDETWLLAPAGPGLPQSQALSAGAPRAPSPAEGAQAGTLGKRGRSKICSMFPVAHSGNARVAAAACAWPEGPQVILSSEGSS